MNHSDDSAERRIFGNYTLIARLAVGGMGEICVARLRGVAGFEKLVVIKRVLAHLAEDAKYIAMLQDEARIAARLSHQNVCQVLDLGQVDGQYYIAMEYLEGVVLSDLLRRMRKEQRLLDPRLVVEMVGQACKGLDAAHNLTDRDGAPLSLVHRDVSPSNLFVTAAGLVKVLDFGIAKVPGKVATTKTGAIKGKWAYMSPEQVMRRPLDRRSDIFSLGVVLWEGLSSRRLFRRPSEYETCRAITEADAPLLSEVRPGLPDELSRVVARALARDPDERFATAGELAKALAQAGASLGGGVSLTEVADFLGDNFAVEIEERRRFIQSVEVKEEDLLAGRDLDLGPLPTAPNPFTQTTAASQHQNPKPTPSALRHDDDEEPTPDTRSMVEPDADPPGPRAVPRPPASRPVSRPHGRRRILYVAAALSMFVMGGAVLAYIHVRSLAGGSEVSLQVNQGGVITEGQNRDAGAHNAGRSPDAALVPGTYAQEHYGRVLAGHQAEIIECFGEYAESVMGNWPTIALKLHIAQSGRVAGVAFEPDELADTPLGECLIRVLQAPDFGPHAEEIDVTIPLGVRGK